EEQASQEPAQGEWSAKQVLSHLCGADDALSMYEFKRFLSEDTPPLGITPGQYSDLRKSAPVPELLSKVESDYSDIGNYFAGLNDQQLNRKPHVPFHKDEPLGETPPLDH